MARSVGSPTAEKVARVVGQITSMMPRAIGAAVPVVSQKAQAITNLLKAAVASQAAA